MDFIKNKNRLFQIKEDNFVIVYEIKQANSYKIQWNNFLLNNLRNCFFLPKLGL